MLFLLFPLVADPTATTFLSAFGSLRDITAVGLLGLVVIAIFVGWLIPRWVYLQKEKEAELYRKLAESERKRADAGDKTIAVALGSLNEIKETLEAIRRPPVGGDSS